MSPKLNDSVFKVISAAKSWNGEVDLLVMGKNTEHVAQKAAKIKDVTKCYKA